MLTEGERVSEANDAFLSMSATLATISKWAACAGRLTPSEFASLDHRACRTCGITELPCYQKEFFRKDGSRVPVLVGAAVIDQEKSAWICFVQDVSPSRRAEKRSGK